MSRTERIAAIQEELAGLGDELTRDLLRAMEALGAACVAVELAGTVTVAPGVVEAARGLRLELERRGPALQVVADRVLS